MPKLVAIYTVEYGYDAKKGEKLIANAGETFTVSEDLAKSIIANGGARRPNEDPIAPSSVEPPGKSGPAKVEETTTVTDSEKPLV